MLALLALALWIGGLVLLTVAPFAGACVAAAGFVAAGASMRRRDSVETLAGMMFLFILGVGAARALTWIARALP